MNRRHDRVLVVMAVLLTVAVWWLVNKVCFQIRTDMAAQVPADELADRMFTDVLDHPWHVSTARVDVLVAFGVVAAIGLVALYNMGFRRQRVGEEHGSAVWGSARDIRPFMDKRVECNVQFTQSEALSVDTLATRRNLNALIVGVSGSGKTRSFIMPNLRRAVTSYAVTDPKGEIYRDYAMQLVAQGYQVRCLDLIDFTQSNHFNPMRYFNHVQPEESILRLTTNLVTNTTSAESRDSGSSFWVSSEKALLNALIAFVYFGDDDPSLPKVLDLVNRMGASEQNENQRFDVDYMFEAAQRMVDEYQRHPDRFDDSAARVVEGMQFAIRQYLPFTRGAGETKKSIIISLGNRLAPMQVGHVRDILSDDTIDLSSVGQERTVLFLKVSDTDRTFSFLAAIFYQCLFEENLYIADHSKQGRLPVHVQCLLDEFANIGKIPDFEQRMSTFRSRGISACIVVQTLGQGKALYKDNWNTIVGNCDSVLYLGSPDKDTNEWLSKMLGNSTIDVREDSQSYGLSGNSTKSWHKVKRELMTPDEIGVLDNDECIYMLRGVRPFHSRKIDPNHFALRSASWIDRWKAGRQ